MSSTREHFRLEVDRYHCKFCGVELPTMLVDGPFETNSFRISTEDAITFRGMPDSTAEL